MRYTVQSTSAYLTVIYFPDTGAVSQTQWSSMICVPLIIMVYFKPRTRDGAFERSTHVCRQPLLVGRIQFGELHNRPRLIRCYFVFTIIVISDCGGYMIKTVKFHHSINAHFFQLFSSQMAHFLCTTIFHKCNDLAPFYPQHICWQRYFDKGPLKSNTEIWCT